MRILLPSLAICLAASTSAAQNPATPDSAAAGYDPVELILVPAGEYFMGEPDSEGDRPAHRVTLDAFYLDKHEVTNRQYLAFCRTTDHRLPEFWGQDRYRCGEAWPNHPVVGVSWWDAQDYAEWVGKRLPTEAEFEYALRGGTTTRCFWGEEPDTARANFWKSEIGHVVEVDRYPANGFGLLGMSGNAAEWTADAYDRETYRQSPVHDPTGPEAGRYKVVRGGGWHTGPGCIAVWFRNALPSNWVDFAVGFRCARDADGGADDKGTDADPDSLRIYDDHRRPKNPSGK